jgi:capsular polysaccharide biosynthesis protein
MEIKNYEAEEFSLREICMVLLRKCWLIILSGIIFAAAAKLISDYLITPIYSSTTSVYVINRDEDNRLTLSDIQTGTQLTKDYMILVKSRPVTEQVIADLKLDITSEELVELIQTETPEDTRILKITVTYPDAEMAKRIADSIAMVTSERMVSVMEMEKVNIIEEGNLPDKPSSPDLNKNIAIGGMIGIGFAVMLITFRFLLNDSIRSTEDIEKHLGLTTLSIIPMEDINYKKRRNKNEARQRKQKSALAG